MSSAIAARTTVLKRGSTAVAEVTSLSCGGVKLDTVDVTAFGVAWKEFVATIKDMGEVTININYVPTNATHKNASGGLLYDLDQATATTYSIVWPDSGGTTWSFSAFVTNFAPTGSVGSALTAAVTLRPTGTPTLA